MPKNNGNPFSVIIIVVLLVLLMAFLIPAVFLAQEEVTRYSLTQNEGQDTTLTTGLIASLKNVQDEPADTPPGQESSETLNITVIMVDANTGETITAVNISQNDTRQIALDSETINITNNQILTDKSAVVTYDYPTYYGWPNGAKFLVTNSAEIVMVLVFMLILSFGFFITRGVKQ